MAKEILFTLLLGAVLAHDSVRLTEIQTLTFKRDRYTTGRRSQPVPQLECVKGCHFGFQPEVVQCRNVGHDGFDVQWRCDASLPDNLALSSTDVSCEGYSSPNDPFVLAGSCGLRYSMTRIGGDAPSYHDSNNRDYIPSRGVQDESSWSGFMFFVLLLVLLFVFCRPTPSAPIHQATYGDGTDGGTGGQHGGAPQGYGYGNNNYGGGGAPGGYGYGAGYGAGCGNPPPAGGGFWTGAGLGGALGYLMGRRQNGWGQNNYGYGYRNGGGYNSGFGGGYARPASSSGASHSGSGSMRTSTGYGTTTRR
eukprot:c12364_g1_i1.p1 GENE.c12364_g1_i1~~c12364_g1_i1.p1  ORF type:complete len:319 (+),score=29.07 c12364_g1_i1:42-959(+)